MRALFFRHVQVEYVLVQRSEQGQFLADGSCWEVVSGPVAARALTAYLETMGTGGAQGLPGLWAEVRGAPTLFGSVLDRRRLAALIEREIGFAGTLAVLRRQPHAGGSGGADRRHESKKPLASEAYMEGRSSLPTVTITVDPHQNVKWPPLVGIGAQFDFPTKDYKHPSPLQTPTFMAYPLDRLGKLALQHVRVFFPPEALGDVNGLAQAHFGEAMDLAQNQTANNATINVTWWYPPHPPGYLDPAGMQVPTQFAETVKSIRQTYGKLDYLTIQNEPNGRPFKITPEQYVALYTGKLPGNHKKILMEQGQPEQVDTREHCQWPYPARIQRVDADRAQTQL